MISRTDSKEDTQKVLEVGKSTGDSGCTTGNKIQQLWSLKSWLVCFCVVMMLAQVPLKTVVELSFFGISQVPFAPFVHYWSWRLGGMRRLSMG